MAQFATVLGALVPIYSLPGVSRRIRFSPQVLAGIYLGTITKWNDPAIVAATPGFQLPAVNIVVIHSANRRGSTYVWSDYLSEVSVEWRTRIGKGISIHWPTGMEAQGHGNVIRMVKETPNSIGYVELAYAAQNGLPHGLVQNAAGNYVSADFASITAAAVAAAKAIPSRSCPSIVNAPGQGSYPISSFTWILISQKMDSLTKQEGMKDLLRWILNEGQTYVEASGFAKLPPQMVEEELTAIDRMR
jgi:phosphate transport system substrate-binding protein